VVAVAAARRKASVPRAEDAMPIIRVEMWQGRTLEQKRQLARELTDVLVRIAGCDQSTVRVLFSEYARDAWAVGGVLESDRVRGQPSRGC
jgi:4-oxalocrotonate tautomerase